jgi:proteasome lid subunit RPN8/RPN11
VSGSERAVQQAAAAAEGTEPFTQSTRRERCSQLSRITIGGFQTNTALFHLPFREFRRLYQRALRAQQRAHLEVVGLLAAAPGEPRVLRLAFLVNCARASGRWELRQEEITKMRRELIRRGLRVVGLFHSHPISKARLGSRDRRNTPTGWAHLVYDVCGLEPRLYMIRPRNGRRRVEELTLSVERSPRRSGRSQRYPR